MSFSADWIQRTHDFLYAQGDPDCHIAMNFDAHFYAPAGVAITSLCENNRDLRLGVHIFTDAASEKDLGHLSDTARRYHANISVRFIEMAPLRDFHIQHHHYNRVAFARLCMPEVMLDYAPRYLYLDADIIVDGSLREMVDFDLQGKTVAGVIHGEDYNRKACAFLGIAHGRFINAGIMLINAARWVEKGYTEKAFSYRGRSAKQFLGHDQDIVNLTADGDIALLPAKFNDFGGHLWNAGEESVIIHFWDASNRGNWRSMLRHKLPFGENMPPARNGRYRTGNCRRASRATITISNMRPAIISARANG